MEIENVLQKCGLSKNEAKAYLKLSEIGLASAYKLSKEANIFKANTYLVLKKLEEIGLVSKVKIEEKVMYEASDPSFLLNILDSKRDKISQIMPSIRLMQKSPRTESIFNVYKGVDSFVNILYHFLEFNDSILVYGAPKKAYELMNYRIGNFHNERIKRKIKMYHIYNFEAMERIKQISTMPLTYAKYLPQLFDSQVSTNICGEEVTFAIWTPPIKMIQIKDKDMAESYKKYFQILWKNSQRVKN